MLPPVEICAAVFKALQENGAIARDDLATSVARIFGFDRTGPDLKAVIDTEIAKLISSGRICEDDRTLRLTT